MTEERGWYMSEVVGAAICNPPVVTVFTISDDLEDAQVSAFFGELNGRECYAYVVHRGKKTPTRALAAYLEKVV